MKDLLIKRKMKGGQTGVKAYLFLDDIQDSIRRSPSLNEPEYSPVLHATAFRHHSEIYDITQPKNGEQISFLKVFEHCYLIVSFEEDRVRIFPSPKEKRTKEGIGSYHIEGYLNEFRKFLKEHIHFLQVSYKEILLHD